jgi:TIR domain
MDVFISWSGERSRAAAEALRGWLPKIINAIKPWLSSADIDKGARWSTDVASRLEAAKAGIICLTPSNLHSDWILFEAGALSKTLQNTYVCPFLIGLDPSDVKPPLAQFQATRAEKKDVLMLLNTLNSALGDNALAESHIDEAFEVWWPKLEIQLKNLPLDESSAKPHRPDRELLEELLGLVRNLNRVPSDFTASARAPETGEDWREFVIKDLIALAFQQHGIEVEKNSYKIVGDTCYANLVDGPAFAIHVGERTTANDISSQVTKIIQSIRDKGLIKSGVLIDSAKTSKRD